MNIGQMMSQPISGTNERLARGFGLAWIAVVACDGVAEQKEIALVANFAKNSIVTEKLFSADWLVSVSKEAGNLIQAHRGLGGLYQGIAEYFKQATDGDKHVLLFTLFHLASACGKISQKEMEVIYNIVNALNYKRDDVLVASLLYISNKP